MTAHIRPTDRVVIGSFRGYAEARHAVAALREAGIPEDRIGLLGPWKDVRHETADGSDPTHSQWEEGAGIGAAAGALLGTGMGLAVAAGLMTPVGPLLAGGLALALLASAGTGAAVGTVVGALAGLGVPEDCVATYQAELESGRVLVVVKPDEDELRVREVLMRVAEAEKGKPDEEGVYGTGLPATPF